MSALARYFKSIGKNVAGYDKTETPLCKALVSEGIDIHYEPSIKQIPKKFKSHNTLVVYTPAVPNDMEELLYFTEYGYHPLKRARVLGLISQNHYCLAVAGTHGKTTTSTLLAHILKQANRNVCAFLGGISTNYNSNFIAGNQTSVLVVEADEYDRSFLQLDPQAAVITSVESDHLDIYGEGDSIQTAFKEFTGKVEKICVVHSDTRLPGMTYGIESGAHFNGDNLQVIDHQFHFDLSVSDQYTIKDITCGLPGRHNVENAIAAAALALIYGLSPEEVKTGIGSFTGVKRRFEYHIKNDDQILIDDYAHHPSEIKALTQALKELYPGQKVRGIFQPHLYSRTRDFEDEFAEALGQLDELWLMDIYPAREKPIPGVTSNALLQKINLEHKQLGSSTEILNHCAQNPQGITVTIGAGDIDQLVQPLKFKLLQ